MPLHRKGAVAKPYETSHTAGLSPTGRRFHCEPTLVIQLASWIISGSLLVGCAAGRSQSADTQAALRTAVETHLAAIATRNMDALLPTLTTGKALTMIAPNGFKWDTPQQYVDFHRQWFATNDEGRFAFEIVRLIDSPALGHALIKYRYASKGSTGQPQTIVSWLALTFALEDGSWRLVFDQNTPLPSQATQ